MWNQDKIDGLESRRAQVLAAGGEARLAKQRKSGKLTARERLEWLFDDGTFVEVGNMMSTRCTDFGMDKKNILGDGVITGYGKIFGRLAFAASQDFTVNGGSLGEAHAKKICQAMDLALEMKAPFISINDSGGARIEEGIDSLNGYGEIFYRNTICSGVIPQISVIMGPCAGGACYSPAITDYIFMVDKTSQMYITGPSVVKTVTGETVTVEELGGPMVHMSKSGVAHFTFPDDEACLNAVRRLLGYFPQSNLENPANVPGIPVDTCEKIIDIVPDNPKRGYDVRDVINCFVDKDSFFEVQPEFAKNIVVGFSRVDGRTIGIVANQANCMAGSLEINASDKASRFIRFCDCFNIPLLSLVDVPAYMPGTYQEYNGIIRHGAKLLYAFSEATVPKVCLIMRKDYGGAYVAMNSKGMSADIVFAWPIAEIAVMGADGAVGVIGRKTIEAAADKEAKRAEMVAEYNDKFMNPYVAASRGLVDEVIHPAETRQKIVEAFDMLENKKEKNPWRKHGNIPL